MKTIKLSLVAVTIALGTFAAFAFTPKESNKEVEITSLHWFESGTGTYLGFDTKANIQSNHCGPAGSNPCAVAYSSITGTPGNEVPAGSQADLATRQ
ncbi:MAG TPA: hypothetical protein PK776_06610 [Flavobacterium sp.]|nr:hypothetical protein [Flavobacterium sp.]